MEIGLIIIFWYGVLHAFGPDHLTAIANFSIGKRPRQAVMITLAFAFGHGIMLFLFSKILQDYVISQSILAYGDIIASSVIVCIGIYLLYMVYSNNIHLRFHEHEGREHVHIWFGKHHEHNDQKKLVSAYTIGMLMGIGGVRGMLVTLGMIEAEGIDLSVVFVFVAGVSVSFALFGIIVSFINKSMLRSHKHVRHLFMTMGMLSLVVGVHSLIG